MTTPSTQSKVTVRCSRCNQLVEGARAPDFTAGFYDVAKGYWRGFARGNEKRLCDNCMHSSPEYQLVFGVLAGHADVRDTLRGRMVAAKLRALETGNPVKPNDFAQIFGPGIKTAVHRGVKHEQE